MSFYRTLLAAFAAVVIASPVLAQDASTTAASSENAPAATENAQPAAASSEQSSAATDAKVNVNTATAKELMKVKGMNASKSRSLVACRKKQKDGKFASVEDISKCKGFTKMKADDLKAIEDQLSVE